MDNAYISRVIIKNYRNFKYTDINLNNKQVIIGENNVGKTNFLRAIQLVLDPSFSDDDRTLNESDFWNGEKNPIENKEVIEIKIYINNFKQNRNILAMLDSATIIDENGKERLLITYRYAPIEMENGKIEYSYIIFKGNDESKRFTYEDRKYLNIKVIKALRDVETEMKNSRISPINRLLKEYEISKDELEKISEKYKETGMDVLALDELNDLSNNINKRFSSVLGNSLFNISLKPMEIEPSKILSSLKLLVNSRNISDISLGINNILYISLILQLLQDKHIPTYVSKDKYDELLKNENNKILKTAYNSTDKSNYFLKNNLSEDELKQLNEFMQINNDINQGITILAIEEPEAHLHPIFQRLIYKDVIRNNNNSVLLTTHSTHITSIAPVNSIVHMQNSSNNGTIVKTTSNLDLEDDLEDIERYLDVKRGEIYLGKGVILVEGIAEEYLVPKFAELLNMSLDEKGIIICNINSTNFKPYVKLLESLDIPYAIITDGDFYYKNDSGEKKFHLLQEDVNSECEKGYDGFERMKKLIIDLKLIDGNFPNEIEEQEKKFKELGIFIGYSTLEIEIMQKAKENNKIATICEVFNSLTSGGELQKTNFKNELDDKKYMKCLNKIENNGIGKGRFAQRLSCASILEYIPEYIADAIKYIYKKVE